LLPPPWRSPRRRLSLSQVPLKPHRHQSGAPLISAR
jgi:hypothetical protein